MTTWTLDTLRALDLKYAKEGLHLHQRPFRAATEILGSAFSMGLGGNPEAQKIMAAYEAMIPEVNSSRPGMGIGLAAVVDQVRKVTVPVVYGKRALEPWSALGFPSQQAWWTWCREDERAHAGLCRQPLQARRPDAIRRRASGARRPVRCRVNRAAL
jgi:hypothetical protein